MISHSELAAARIVLVKARGMLRKRYIPWLRTQGCRDCVRTRMNGGGMGRRCARRTVLICGSFCGNYHGQEEERSATCAQKGAATARMGVGMPPTERTIPDKRQKAP